jgi:UDP-glucose 4-epimerase/UDP-arabinose 4-epimerase
MGASILVTGGAGYIGAHTCKALAGAGYIPVTYDNLSTGRADFVRWGPFVEGDIADSAKVTETCRSYGVVAAIHFAADAIVEESVIEPAKYYRNNVAFSLSLLEGLRAAGVGNIVYSSSSAVYGAPKEQPITEETRPNPINPYGMSKLMVERILSDYERAYQLRWIALRYFNVCGAHPEGDIGEFRHYETRLIPRAMMWLQGYVDELRVFGSDYPTPDGTAIRDYIHVCDLAQGHILALRKLLTHGEGGVFNLGSGLGYSVKDVLDQIEKTTNSKFPTILDARRPGDPPVLLADPARARNHLGFVTVNSQLPNIIATAWRWHQKAHPIKNQERGSRSQCV